MLLINIFSFFLCTTLIISSSTFLIKEWTDDQIALLDESSSEINRIYFIYADWCGACRRFKPKFSQIIPKLVQLSPSPLEIIQIDLDKAHLLSSRFRISHLPSLFHQIGGEFRKIDSYRENLDKYFEEKAWIGIPTMGPLSLPRDKISKAPKGAPQKKLVHSVTEYIDSLGVTFPTFLLLSSSCLLFIAFFVIWCVWLYTDYKLNAHNFTDEAIKERIKFLKTQPEFRDQFDLSEVEDKDESGEESDTTQTQTEPETSLDDSTPLRGRRSIVKNRLK
jgi:thiol-disulfide isomerase/thioredoxin